MVVDKKFYEHQIIDSILPFWKGAVDNAHGGIYTCFNNRGTELLSKDKYVWSQGRYLWLWSKIIYLIRKSALTLDEQSYVLEAKKTLSFLLDNAFLENGNAIFLLDEKGTPKTTDGVYDSSIYVDCFLSLGFSEYARVFNDKSVLDKSVAVYENIIKRIDENNYMTSPYPIPKGYEIFGIPMFVMHTGAELASSLKANNDERHEAITKKANKYLDILFSKFIKDGHNAEMLSSENNSDTLLSKHFTPGHTLECLWFIIHFLEDTNNVEKYISIINEVGKNAFEKGWDNEHGGLFRFVDMDGGQPKGRLINDTYENLVVDTWDYKLWWVHSETLYFTSLMSKYCDNDYWQNAYNKVADYTFKTFPNDKSIGEWIQIRMRDATPVDKVVALPVKDPYHILRNFLLMLEL